MTKELSLLEYERTMIVGMNDVTETAEPIIDIWPYVEKLVENSIVLPYVFENNLVEQVYRSNDNKYDHILLPTEKQNYFVVLVIDRTEKILTGHYFLDLNKLYS